MDAGTLRIGTSGWNYPTGRGTWNGVFYPPTKGRGKAFDELAYYSTYFNTVEVNSTFYGQPRPDVCRGWADRTPEGFEFSIKLYQKFTHPRMFRERVAGALPTDVRSEATLVDAIAQPNQADIDEFRRGIEPLVEAGKLGALLAQFPASFKADPSGREHLQRLLETFREYSLAVELRHRSWSDAVSETVKQLNEFKAAWVQIDEPKFKTSIRQNLLPNVDGSYYIRLHGRNAAAWWRHEKAEDRYDYLYASEELREFTGALDASRRIVKKAYLYTNNHFSAKSVVNAAMIKVELGEPQDTPYPETLRERYPELASIPVSAPRQPAHHEARKITKQSLSRVSDTHE